MGDIHQEWADLRKKNGEFICHLDGEMKKLEKDKYHQDLLDASAYAMRFITLPPLSCCPDNSDILKALDKAQAERDKLAETISKMEKTIRDLRYALDQAAKDAEANFNRGRIKSMEEAWDELRAVYSDRTMGKNKEIFGYGTVGYILENLSPTWFINRAEEYHEEEKKIKIGDEVEIFDTSCPDDNPHSDIGIVIAIGEDNPGFTIFGPKFQAFFNETDIESGRVKKTGKHFDFVPLDYFA